MILNLNNAMIVRVDKTKNKDLKIVLKCAGQPDKDYSETDEAALRHFWENDTLINVFIESNEEPQNPNQQRNG